MRKVLVVALALLGFSAYAPAMAESKCGIARINCDSECIGRYHRNGDVLTDCMNKCGLTEAACTFTNADVFKPIAECRNDKCSDKWPGPPGPGP